MAIENVETLKIVVDRDGTEVAARSLVGAALSETVEAGQAECPAQDCAVRGEAFFHLERDSTAACIARISCTACASPDTVGSVAARLDAIADSVTLPAEQSA